MACFFLTLNVFSITHILCIHFRVRARDGPPEGPQRPRSSLISGQVSVRFILAEYGPEQGHRVPCRHQLCYVTVGPGLAWAWAWLWPGPGLTPGPLGLDQAWGRARLGPAPGLGPGQAWARTVPAWARARLGPGPGLECHALVELDK